MAKKDLIKRADGSYSPRGLWDNIRANKGSGKEPTKEMLAQEKKIKREMANGGKLSHFYPSNIQAYAEGGGIDLPRSITNGGITAMPYYSDTRGGAGQAQYGLGFGTMPSAAKGGWNLSGSLGKEYESKPNPEMVEMWQNINDFQNAGGVNPFGDSSLLSKVGSSIAKPFFPNPNYKGPAVNFNATYRGKKGLDGQRFVPFAEVGANYTPSSGLGIYGGGGGEFPFGKNNYRQGLIRSGYAAGGLGPHAGFSFSSSQAGPYYGLKGHLDYRPKFFGDFPGMLKAEGHLGVSPAMQGNINAGQTVSDSITYGGKVGMYMPVQKLKQHMPSVDLSKMNLPEINMPNISLPEINKSTTYTKPTEVGTGWGEFGPVNASPIEGRWNKEAGDIYINHNNALGELGTEPITYDPADPEAVFNNQYSKGGAMNFKSPAAYKAWLAYGHASGEFAKTPGNQAVSIKGQPHKVQHAFGGNMYSMGGRAFAQGGQLTEFTEGGSHEMNPLGGIPQGFAPDGKLNLVEQGETKLNAADYVFSDQIKVSKETASLYGLSKSDVGKTFAEVSKKANRPDSRRENDTIEQVAIQRDLENLMQAQEQQKETEKQEAIAEMQSKYPDLQVVDQAAMQQAAMEQPMADEAMMQQQQQMAPPAQAPQEMDPAMMAQMQQQGMMRHGGKMYNMGGHMYSMGGNVALRGIGAAAYGVGEGLVDNLTFGLTDTITDKGYEKLSNWNTERLDEKDQARLDATRNFGNVAGQVGGAVLTGGTTTKQAIGAGVENLGQGIAALPGTDENVDKYAKAAGQLGSMYGQFFGGAPANMSPAPAGVLAGNEAVTKMMNAPQNKFISQAMQIGGQYMRAEGGFLNQPTGGMFTNQFEDGGPKGEPIAVFNIGGTPVTMTLSEALKNPTILEAFETPEAIIEHFQTASVGTRPLAVVPTAPTTTGTEEEEMAKELLGEDEGDGETTAGTTTNGLSLERLPGETDAEYQSRLQKFITSLSKKDLIGEIKANPVLAGAMALPALYNIGRGLFGKVDKLDVNDFTSVGKINPYEMNVDPQLASTQRAYSTAMQAAKNAAPGAGSYLATLGNLASQKQQAIKDIYAQKENFDKAQKLEADKYNAQVDQGNLDKKLAVTQYNAQAEAAKANLLAQGLTQAAQAAEGLSSQDLQEAYLHAIAPDLAAGFSYQSIGEQMAAAARRNKNTDKTS